MSEERSEYIINPQPDVVPIYNRADITPHDLAVLKRKIAELECRVKQADQEYDSQNAIIGYLFCSLGFVDWSYTYQGAVDAIKSLTDLVAGRMTPEEFGNDEDDQESLIYHLIRLVER